MSADIPPDNTTPQNTTPHDTAPAPDPAAVVPPRHRRRRGRTTVVLAAVVAAAVAGAVSIGQLDKPAAAKTASAVTNASAPSSGSVSSGTSSGTSSSDGSSVGNADWSPYGGYGYGYGYGWGGYADPWSYVPSYGYGDGQGSTGSSSAATQGSGSPSDVSTIAATVDPALVDINSTFGYEGASGAGTGIVLTSTGEILTNNHVIDGATAISVVDVGNGKTYKATVVGYDKTHDIAVLQLRRRVGVEDGENRYCFGDCWRGRRRDRQRGRHRRNSKRCRRFGHRVEPADHSER